jgi:hypothetical protein
MSERIWTFRLPLKIGWRLTIVGGVATILLLRTLETRRPGGLVIPAAALVAGAILATGLALLLVTLSIRVVVKIRGLLRLRRATLEALGFDPARLVEGAGPGAIFRLALHSDEEARKDGLAELAALAANAKGLLVYGARFDRLAAPWSALSLERASLSSWVRVRTGDREHQLTPWSGLRELFPALGAPRLLADLEALRAHSPLPPPTPTSTCRAC